MMLRMLCLLASVVLAFAAGCQREGEASRSRAAPSEKAPAAEGSAKAAAEPSAKAEVEAGGEGMSCGQDKESCGGGCNQWDEAAAEVLKRDLPEEAVWRTLEVSGMHCGGCERRIVASVGSLDGVLSVEADAELGVVRVALAPEASEPAEAAAAQIQKLGYGVR